MTPESDLRKNSGEEGTCYEWQKRLPGVGDSQLSPDRGMGVTQKVGESE